MRIANILVTHSFFPEKLFASIDGSKAETDWIVFFHGHNRDLQERIGIAVEKRSGRYFPYATDRGLSKSWNEGLSLLLDSDHDLMFLLNDDLFFYPNGFDEFAYFCAETFQKNPTAGLTLVTGLESGGSHLAGQTMQQGLACCSVARSTLDRIGCFDENFRPAYFEDIDYVRRLYLAGMTQALDNRVLVEHERGLTARLDPDLAARNAQIHGVNQHYYSRKWGGPQGQERFTRPFDDERFDLKIDFANRNHPYAEYDRLD